MIIINKSLVANNNGECNHFIKKLNGKLIKTVTNSVYKPLRPDSYRDVTASRQVGTGYTRGRWRSC